MDKVRPKEHLKGENVFLKKHNLALAETMFSYIQQDRERLRTFLPWVDYTKTLEDERGYIRMTMDWWADHAVFDYGVFRASDSVYLGNIGVHSISWQNEHCEIGYWVLGEFEGRGYVSEAVRVLEKELFRIGFNRIEIRCSSKNTRSAAVPRRTGYTLEGVLRQDTLEHGAFRDTLIFAKLRSDFLSKSQDQMVP